MKRVLHGLFLVVLGAQILLSRRAYEVNAAVAFHAASLALFLTVTIAASAIRPGGFRIHAFSRWIIAFAAYFFGIGVVMSALTGAGARDVFEVPYRMSPLLIALLYPNWINREADVRFVLGAAMALVVVQAFRDIAVSAAGLGTAFFAQRLWSPEFSSYLFVPSFAFLAGWTIASSTQIAQRALPRGTMVVSAAILAVKTILVYSRTMLGAVLPWNMTFIAALGLRRQFRSAVRPMMVLFGVFLLGALVVVATRADVRTFMSYRFGLLGHSASIKMDEFAAIASQARDHLVLGRSFAYEAEFWKGGQYRLQSHVHNVFLQFLLSSGLVGLTVFLWGIVSILTRATRIMRRPQSRLELGAAVSVLLAVSSLLLMALVESLFRRDETYLVLAICMALIVGIENVRKARGLEASVAVPSPLTQP